VTSNISRNITSNLIWHHITEPIGSTQDEIRKILQENKISNEKAIAVVADIQLNGRGTQGRRWEMGDIDSTLGDENHRKDNNLYMTVGIPLDRVPIQITLLPLQIGVFVAERVSYLIEMCQTISVPDNPANDHASDKIQMKFPKVTVKWPNDVLVDQRKISGTLIETETVSYDNSSSYGTSWMLIGIGINVATAPRNLMSSHRPGKHIRPPCCIQDFCDASFNQMDGIHATRLPSNTATILGQDLASAIADWVLNEHTVDKAVQEEQLIQQWRAFAEWGVQYELRGRVVDEEHGGYEGERVTTIGIERDGQLRVRGADGRERLLVADYLF
jgi:BirA family biotin operon repressor/biotin-[acetyl-CoA-carboxylase] ligase